MKISVLIGETRTWERCVMVYIVKKDTCILYCDADGHHVSILAKLLKFQGLLTPGESQEKIVALEKSGTIKILGGGFIRKIKDDGGIIQTILVEESSTGIHELLCQVDTARDISKEYRGIMPVGILEKMAPEIIKQYGAKKIDFSYFYKLESGKKVSQFWMKELGL